MLTHELRVQGRRAAKSRDLQELCGAFIESCRGTWLIRPYLENDEAFKDLPEWHQRIISTIEREDAKVMVAQDQNSLPDPPAGTEGCH